MELMLNHLTPDYINQSDMKDLLVDVYSLLKNFNLYAGKKVKISFVPNTYYDHKIYRFLNYTVDKTSGGLSITFGLQDGENVFQFTINNIFKLESKPFFNRIEYKASSSETGFISHMHYSDTLPADNPDPAEGRYPSQCSEYNFCLYD